ncbi:chemotaxis histidine kinase/response regulator CheAY2 [Helicobacter pylori]|uniref:chemotaxis histidine kinase/response regulator CheAY2 n=1 Tax=Helicobacter pylori TaxID=210 RepID=UPI00287B8B22|nr:chemotaxis histidine kinase/response regulator CheAY2 [Helicobacter pylori]WNE32138.1 chemotaxis histidine kinase/response regulator CheAY2 [Helicobacter pylori]WNE33565.1 chemotaxis histidine kinase/response regulator CheAY2 [Helicobacter pylori]WNE34993.1 chemotaxis histidine kinase/response regulator CheAY2 [Helicobacter pylori]WNE36417.1 chemotaxis histidine kinase/response regulator CheAY2 [Helicobacter pylori]WNE37845.1 chemotaxis histidine kinase/response regulator CheAY2 [Helicobact
MDDLQEIMEDFLIEAFEMNEQLDQDLVELEHNPEDLDLLNRIFRVAHTIKGSSSFLNLNILTHLTHNMEDVLNRARKGEIKITPDIMDVVLRSIDLMKTLLVTIRDTGSDTNNGKENEIEEAVKQLQAITSQNLEGAKEGTKEAPPKKNQEEVKKEAKKENIEENQENKAKAPTAENSASDNPLADEPDLDYTNMSAEEVEAEIERLLNKRQEADKERRALKKQEAKPKQEVAPTKETPKTETPKAPKTETKAKAKADTEENKAPSIGVEQTVRVDVRRLDHLMNLIGELVLGKNRLIRIYGDVEERYDGEKFLEELNQVVSSISAVTTDLQLAVMKTRMQPVGKVFNKFPRMVRDLSRELGKSIELIIEGEETELDKSIVEEIGDPLIHIIRNSCDHGIEPLEERRRLNKPETGKVQLSAYNEGNHIVIKISDDGKGLDPVMLKEKAIEKGVISERDAEGMSDREAFNLIFKPGFSTAKVVSNVSGRGVGMDVVKTNIEKLNGIIEIDSEVGVGTTQKLKIPLTLAIIQALLVGVQEEYYAIPLSSVLETVRISQDEIYTVDGKSVLRLRDEVLSLVRLSDIFKVDAILESNSDVYVVIIGLADQKIGVIVDYLIGQEEVVIKSLGYYLKNTRGIAGATVRGDGKITLIVDVGAMMDMAKSIKVNITTLMNESENTKSKNSPSDYIVLAIDDSSTDRAIIRKCLKPLGITLLEATNGLEGLEMLKNGDKIPDAILVDIEMPKMDGYTFASEVRKYNKFKNLPLIAVTSRVTKTDRMRGVESGMTEYITKPYSGEYLTTVVKRSIKLEGDQS